MRILNNLMHSLTLLSLLVVCIHTSWSVDVKTNEQLLSQILQNSNDQDWKKPTAGVATASAAVGNIKPLSTTFLQPVQLSDERISDIIAENVLHFGHSLAQELAALDPKAEKSEIFSPLSIMAALSLLTLGAKGRSYQELKQLLAMDSDSELIENPSKYHEEFGLMLNDLQHTNLGSGGVSKRVNALWRSTVIKTAPVRSTGRIKPPVEHVIKVANGLFVQSGYTINPDYSKVLKSIYAAQLEQLDFLNRNLEARDYINNWVDRATFGKIPEIISGDIDKSTNVILASVLYFKAFWETSFFSKVTVEDNFYPDGVNNAPIKAKMMPSGGIFPFYDAKEYDCRIIGLPYKGNETTMYVIQPNNSNRQKLRELQSVLTARKINAMIDRMERKTTVMVFPKMHFTRSLNLKSILKNMNINDIFINGYSDLSLIGGVPTVGIAQPPLAPALAPTSAPVPEKHIPETVTVSYESINRKMPMYGKPLVLDRYNEPGLIFTSRLGEINENMNNTMPAAHDTNEESTKIPTTTLAPESPKQRVKRQIPIFNRNPAGSALLNLEENRQKPDTYRGDLYVDEILHKVDFNVDEEGTEAAAATLTYLHRSGTDVVFRGETPFLIIIRHDPTKLPLFYGVINKPEL